MGTGIKITNSKTAQAGTVIMCNMESVMCDGKCHSRASGNLDDGLPLSRQ